jgi:lysyl-tRNA synthetase, class II
MERGSVGSPAWHLAAALSTGACGLLTVISAVTDDVPWRHDVLLTIEPGPLMAIGHVLALVAGLVLLYLARAILHRNRRALDTAIAVLLAVALLHLVKGLDFEEAGVALVLAAVLARGRRMCTRRAVARPPLLAATITVGAAAAAYAVSCISFDVPGRHHSLETVLTRGAHMLGSGRWLHAEQPTPVILALLLVAAICASVAMLHGLLRPALAREGHSAAEHARAARIVQAFGHDSLAPFVLREDKAFFFAHGGFVAYRTLHETAVVSGDPIGPPQSAPAILRAFLAHADACGWRVAVAAASPALAEVAADVGLRSLQVGREAVVDARTFTLQGRAVRKVRQAIARSERHGWTSEVVLARDLDAATLDQIAALEHEFTSSRPRVYGFAMSLGRLWGAPEDDDAIYALGHAPDGRIAAFIRFVPYLDGLSLDAVRRSDDMPNGVCEGLVVAAIDYARSAGLAEVSLNFAGFAHVMAPDRPLTKSERLLRAALGAVHGRFQLERLVVWGNHFVPAWRPRYMLYGGRAELPRSALRVLQAERYLPSRPVPRLKPRWEPALPSLPTLAPLQRR